MIVEVVESDPLEIQRSELEAKFARERDEVQQATESIMRTLHETTATTTSTRKGKRSLPDHLCY